MESKTLLFADLYGIFLSQITGFFSNITGPYILILVIFMLFALIMILFKKLTEVAQ